MQSVVKKAWAVTAVLALSAGGTWLLRQRGPEADPPPQAQASKQGAWRFADAGSVLGLGSESSGKHPIHTPDQIRTRLFKHGSFAGTEPAGSWCIANKQLKPCSELRSRFEYYVLGLGEVSIDEIKSLIQDEARRENGDLLAAQIMTVWDRYWQVRTYDWRNKFVQGDRATWTPVFEEQRFVRRQVMGADWAEAFFKDDEKQFQDYYAQLESGQPPPPDPGEPVPQMAPGKDAAAVRAERVRLYGEAAADRLAKADEEWAQWQTRLSAAQHEWDRLQKSDNLSTAQRAADMLSYIKSNFPPDEQSRVKALLHV